MHTCGAGDHGKEIKEASRAEKRAIHEEAPWSQVDQEAAGAEATEVGLFVAKRRKAKEAKKVCGMTAVCLPTYSPDLNPLDYTL